MNKLKIFVLLLALSPGLCFGNFSGLGDGVTGMEYDSNTYIPGSKVFTPVPEDIYDLDHNDYYIWNIDLAGIRDNGNVVQGAELVFRNISNWVDASNTNGQTTDNRLFLRILDGSGADSLTVFNDDQIGDTIEDALDGQGIVLGEWVNNPSGEAHDLVFSIGEGAVLDAINAQVLAGSMAFGIDPDCHFWNDGVTLALQVPAPGALLLGSLGMSMVGWLRRRKSI